MISGVSVTNAGKSGASLHSHRKAQEMNDTMLTDVSDCGSTLKTSTNFMPYFDGKDAKCEEYSL